MLYVFKTKVSMKPVDREKWYIDPNFIKLQEIEGDNVKDALNKYVEVISDNPYYCFVSKTALRRKNKMYIDTKDGAKQIGYVITAKTSFEKNYYNWIDKYIDLWVEINELKTPAF